MFFCGSPKENRTPDSAVRGQRLNRLTMGPYIFLMAPGLGLEPRQCDPESHVLPLHNPGSTSDKVYYTTYFKIYQP